MEKTTSTHKKASSEEVEYLIYLLSQIYPVSESLREVLHENIISLELQKDDYLLQQGERCCYMYFIKTGALTSYVRHNKKKITTYISIENEFVSSLSGLFGDQPSKEAIVAIEPTALMGLHTDILLRLFETNFDINYIFRAMLEKYYRDAEERSYIVRLGNARERYLYFMQTKPGYVERLPVEPMASLLDMKPETLLRIRKQLEMEQQKNMDSEALCKRLETYMDEKLSFKQQDISLVKLASALELTPHKLSWLLNTAYGMNFKNFINKYRIDYIKNALLSQTDWYSFTLESLALDAGFSSRSTFYTTFKKQVGVKPIEFAKNQKAQIA